jgi:hypothetical protein
VPATAQHLEYVMISKSGRKSSTYFPTLDSQSLPTGAFDPRNLPAGRVTTDLIMKWLGDVHRRAEKLGVVDEWKKVTKALWEGRYLIRPAAVGYQAWISFGDGYQDAVRSTIGLACRGGHLADIVVPLQHFCQVLTDVVVELNGGPADDADAVEFGRWRVTLTEATFDGVELPKLKKRHLRLLLRLVAAKGLAVPLARLHDHTAGPDAVIFDSTLRTYASAIRKSYHAATGDKGSPIMNVSGQSYRLVIH